MFGHNVTSKASHELFNRTFLTGDKFAASTFVSAKKGTEGVLGNFNVVNNNGETEAVELEIWGHFSISFGKNLSISTSISFSGYSVSSGFSAIDGIQGGYSSPQSYGLTQGIEGSFRPGAGTFLLMSLLEGGGALVLAP